MVSPDSFGFQILDILADSWFLLLSKDNLVDSVSVPAMLFNDVNVQSWNCGVSDVRSLSLLSNNRVNREMNKSCYSILVSCSQF